jgi:hypothetical protein
VTFAAAPSRFFTTSVSRFRSALKGMNGRIDRVPPEDFSSPEKQKG